MRIKLLSFCTFFVAFLGPVAHADTFIVTSNADSGPGTLRAAINAANANGTLSTDNIHFNIADLSFAGRTIVLQSALPFLSSNLIIDASTQPGIKFGVSDTKIKLKHGGTTNFSQGFVLSDVEFIELYGIYFNDFRYGDNNGTEVRCALYVPGLVQHIKLGAPGKGNLFFDNAIAIANRYVWNDNPGDRFGDIEIKSNFFGLNEDGFTPQSVGPAFIIRSFRNITIGGPTEQEGNYFASSWNGSTASFVSDKATGNGFFRITNNCFGKNYTKTNLVSVGSFDISGDYSGYNRIMSDVIVTISKNTFDNSCNRTISLSNISGFITITGNKVGASYNWSGCQYSGIAIGNCEDGIIGGDTPEDQNIIAWNAFTGIYLANNKNFTIQQNSIYCNGEGIEATSTKVQIPEVKIMNENGIDFVSGTATPNCKIEVFQTPQCAGCDNGAIYMGQTTSDNNGNWSFTGPFNSAVTARATSSSGASGEFAKPEVVQSIDFETPVCNQTNGFITGTKLISGTRYYWIRNYNGKTDTIFNQLDLVDIGPGIYTFVVEQTAYCKKSYSMNLLDASPVLNEQYVSLTHPSCGLFNGQISNISANGRYNKVFWLSESGDTVSTSLELRNAAPGNYKLIVLNTTYNCGDSTGFYTLVNQSGPTLNFNSIQITDANCSSANASIKNIVSSNVTGTPYIQWLDSINNPVGHSLDLLNVPPGKYQLKFKDESGCDTIISAYFLIKDQGAITIDIDDKLVAPAGCTVNNGSIHHIHITGADTWQWKNLTTNTNAGNALDISALSAGNYQLTASNAFGCSLNSPVIAVTQAQFASIIPQQATVKDGNCGDNNGSINLAGFSNEAALLSYYWINTATNQIVGNDLNLAGLGTGIYTLMATDTNGCQQAIFTQPIIVNAKPVFNTAGLLLTDDQCSLLKGSISGIKLNNLQAPATYTWTYANNLVAGNSPDLSNIGAGNYRLTVKDRDMCIIESDLFIINNNDNTIKAPLYDDMMIQRNSAVTLVVKNFQNGNYVLYSDAAGTQILQQNTTGIFITATLGTDKIFYVQYVNGSCRSPLVRIKITVVDQSIFAIPTAFTPNDDGLNDKLALKVIGYIEVEHFRIYNRNGELVFSTNTINNGWDGNLKGSKQPSGAYVWMAKGKDITGKTITGKGSFVLIR